MGEEDCWRAFCRLVGLPQCLMPRLSAWERVRDGRYEFEVDIRLPLLGRLVQYGGLMSLEAG